MFLKNPWVVDASNTKPLETAHQSSKRRKREMEEKWDKKIKARIAESEIAPKPALSDGEKARAEQYEQELAHAQDVLRSDKFARWYETTTGEPVDKWRKKLLISEREYVSDGSKAMLGMPLLDWIYESVRFIADSHPYSNPYLQDGWAEQLRFIRGPERRQILIQLATPKWVSWAKDIKPFYQRAADLFEETGIPHDVDHVVPITHHLVCGLNVPSNLQVVTASENRKKSNKFEIS